MAQDRAFDQSRVPKLGANLSLPPKGSIPQADWNLANNAIGAMKKSGRSNEFIQSNLGKKMAMDSPNWGLTSEQGAKARAMVNSGRTQSFIRKNLGVGSDTYVPGKIG